MGTLPGKSNANRAARLLPAITMAVGVLALVGGIAEYGDSAAHVSRAEAILTVGFGLACLGVGLRVRYGTARRGELVVLAGVLAVLVIIDAWLSSSAMHLFGLAIPAALLLLTAGAAPRQE